MLMKIGGDTLALDADIRRQIESEAQTFAARFPDGQIDARITIQEEFDPLHGHRVRCELSARIGAGRQVVVREAHKTAGEAIREVFNVAGRNVRRLRRQHILSLIPAPPPVMRTARAATR
jgi:ribosome-associated translation inhibitor RaiA